METTKRTPIRLKHGEKKTLARLCGVSEMTVYRALNYKFDTVEAENIRQAAYEYGLVRTKKLPFSRCR